MMRQKIEKALFDWSRDRNPRIQSRGTVALLAQKVKISENSKMAGTTRCVWPTAPVRGETRYLSRRIWMS